MSDAARTAGSATGPQETDLLERLVAAEAQIEFLQNAVKSQEYLAEQLAIATAPPALAGPAVATSAPSPTWLRAVSKLLRRWRADPAGVLVQEEAPVGLPSRWSGTELTDPRYPQWIGLYDTVDEPTQAQLRARLESLAAPPLISIVFPVYNTPEEFLREAIESVRGQLYAELGVVHLR